MSPPREYLVCIFFGMVVWPFSSCQDSNDCLIKLVWHSRPIGLQSREPSMPSMGAYGNPFDSQAAISFSVSLAKVQYRNHSVNLRSSQVRLVCLSSRSPPSCRVCTHCLPLPSVYFSQHHSIQYLSASLQRSPHPLPIWAKVPTNTSSPYLVIWASSIKQLWPLYRYHFLPDPCRMWFVLVDSIICRFVVFCMVQFTNKYRFWLFINVAKITWYLKCFKQ